MKYTLIFIVLADHQTILLGGVSMFFNTFPYSLFSVELTDDQKTFRYKRVEQADTNDRGFKAHLNDYATSCLLKKDTIKAKDFIKTAIEVDGENMKR